MGTNFDLRSIELFGGLNDADLARLASNTTEIEIAPGDELFCEGDVGDDAYIIASGEVEILKRRGDTNTRIAVSGAGDLVGEMALLANEPRNASARAITDVTLVVIPHATFNHLIETSASAMRSLFDVFVQRWREQENRVRQSERMAQLGILTAGLAHEMNNPAAAVTRGAEQLEPLLERLAAAIRAAPEASAIVQPDPTNIPTNALERSDREAEIEDALASAGVSEPWNLAPALADAGIEPSALSELASSDEAAAVVEAVAVRAETESLVREIQEGASRLSELVAALKGYSFLDQAPVQQTDVVKGLEDTLLILRSKLKDISIVKEFDPDLPSIMAYGSQLNQVWTNLIDNAAFALHDAEVPEPRITLRARRDDGWIRVEVEDNGPGIPDETVGHIFDAFFTTKPPGVGTGIGLNTTYGIVVNDHRGEIDVDSSPAGTRFVVRLPTEMATSP